MKKGRFSKSEQAHISENIESGYEKIAKDLDRDPKSMLEHIKKQVAKGKYEKPAWMSTTQEEAAAYDLGERPYFIELRQQFTEEELKLFKYHWARIISQFRDDVIPTEELQVVDLIKLELLMNRALKGNKENLEQISALDALSRAYGRPAPFNFITLDAPCHRQVAAARWGDWQDPVVTDGLIIQGMTREAMDTCGAEGEPFLDSSAPPRLGARLHL